MHLRQDSRLKVTRLGRRSTNVKIHLGNLFLEITEEELRRKFMVFGEVIFGTIMNDKYIGSGQLRG